ncbi:pilus assembly protein [Collimonas humicola]|uniref:pilus assembly protein n=1 Tax=Collimonas humicola TaxID=2825886 RepID=UPI001B8B7C04|nr:PilC/PilY family type IV pilus protein [Collimonas humicola]
MSPLLPCICAIVLVLSSFSVPAAETPDEPPFVYVGSYEAGSWLGHVKAYPVGADGVAKVARWDAADLIPPWQSRRIGTASGNANAIAFEWPQLDDAQRAVLSSEDLLEYLRGNDALEARHGVGGFRNRQGKLGDIMYSTPLYVGLSDSAYQFLPGGAGGSAYREYVKSKKQRLAMLYVGANDGMLHAFDALDGVETSAFVPSAVFDALPRLSEAGYLHRPFVDGLLSVGDAYLGAAGNAAWKSILLGATGGGARSLFALDVSTPPAPAPLLWQRSAEDDGAGASDDDMGHLVGEAFAVRLANGAWAAIYGNGYQSENLRAVLYLVELSGGGLIKKIAIAAGDAESPNGLAAPALVFNPQRAVSAIYAGDLQGRLWKVDLSADEPQRWQVAFSKTPLFIAADKGGKPQSIAQQPLLEQHAKGGALVMFSGGKPGDGRIPGEAQRQSLYGVWDKAGSGAVGGREQLQQQVLSEGSDGTWQLSNNGVNWGMSRGWYVDLPEKIGYVVGKLQIVDGLLWLLTYAPASDKSYLLALDYNNGGASSDGAFIGHLKNAALVEVPASIITPIFIKLPDGRKQLVIAGRDGLPHAVDINPRTRPPVRTWRQLPVPAAVVDPD